MAVTLAKDTCTRRPPERNAFRAREACADSLAPAGLDFIERRYLLALARMSVGSVLELGELPSLRPWEAPSPGVLDSKASFVTINSSGNLRGCIGSLQAHMPLMYDVIGNAARSAFHDGRFPPLSREELGRVRFSVSVLENPEPLKADSSSGLLAAIEEGKHGLIIRKGVRIATYLPYVWRIFPGKEEFLENLCKKAGLGADEWKEPGMDFFTYEAQEFSE